MADEFTADQVGFVLGKTAAMIDPTINDTADLVGFVFGEMEVLLDPAATAGAAGAGIRNPMGGPMVLRNPLGND